MRDLRSNAKVFHENFRDLLRQGKEPTLLLSEENLDGWREALYDLNGEKLNRRVEWERQELFATDNVNSGQRDAHISARTYTFSKKLLSDTDFYSGVDNKVVELLRQKSVHLPFVNVWLIAAAKCLQIAQDECTKNHTLPNFTDDAWADLGISLLARLTHISEQVFWYEFDRQRLPKELADYHFSSIEERDKSENPAYQRFLRELSNGKLRQLLSNNSVFERHICLSIGFWIENSIRLVQRISDARSVLESRLGVPAEISCSRIEIGAGDSHNGHQTVAILHFTLEDREEATRKIVYKPRSLALDGEFFSLIENINETYASALKLRTLKILDFGDFGISEYCPQEVLQGNESLEEFYECTGQLLAILYLLGCSDCHFENLIATKKGLCLVDTETLFEPKIQDHLADASSGSTIESAVQRSLDDSVLRTGLLPHWTFLGKSMSPVDISALGVDSLMSSMDRKPGWLHVNTDGMMPGRVDAVASQPTSLPVRLGRENPFRDFVEPLCRGFREQLGRISVDKSYWRERLAKFQGLTKRVVPRPTRVYYGIQRQQFQAVALCDEIKQGMVLELLARAYLTSDRKPAHFSALASEIEQMQTGDIPYFEQTTDSINLTRGEETIVKAYSAQDGYSEALRRLEELDDARIARELSLIAGTARAKDLRLNYRSRAHSHLQTKKLEQQEQTSTFDHHSWKAMKVKAATRVADQILAASVTDAQGNREWIGLDIAGDNDRYYFGALGNSVYSGSLGLAILLAALGDSYIHAARSVTRGLLEFFQSTDDLTLARWWRDQPKGLLGGGGVVLAIQKLAELDKELGEEYKNAEQRLVSACCGAPFFPDSVVDIMDGLAGLVGPLILHGSDESIDRAIHIGDHLLAIQGAAGGWIPRNGGRALTGFSHGAAGVASALCVLGTVTNATRFIDGARRSLNYERELFDKKTQNWPDFRFSDEAIHFACGWCNGAPGILLSRLCLCGTELEDHLLAKELSIAIETTSREEVFVDHVCCGRFGRSAILHAAGRGDLAQRLECITEVVEPESSDSFKLVAHVEGQLALPGLFTGLGGIALSLADPYLLAGVMSAGLIDEKIINPSTK